MDSQMPQNPAPGSSNKTAWIVGVVVVVVLVVAGVMYANKDTSTTETANTSDTTTPADTATTPADTTTHSASEWANGSVMDDGTKVFSLVGNNFAFTPNQIKVNKGDKVKVMLLAQDMPHDFVIEGYGSDVRTKVIQPGNTDFVMFTADKAGTFTFYCSVGQHRANGMVGTIMVME